MLTSDATAAAVGSLGPWPKYTAALGLAATAVLRRRDA